MENVVKNFARVLMVFTVTFGSVLIPCGTVFASEDDEHSDHHSNEETRSSGEAGQGDHKHEDESSHKETEDHNHEGEHEEGKDEHGDHDGEHGEHEESFGEGKAITAVRGEGQFFKLSDLAKTTLGVQLGPLRQVNEDQFEIPVGALVRFQNERGVYRITEGWFELVTVKVVSEQGNSVVVESGKLTKSDKVAVRGIPLLRVAHLQASGQGGKGHAH